MQFYNLCQYFIAFALILRFGSDKEQKLYNHLLEGPSIGSELPIR